MADEKKPEMDLNDSRYLLAPGLFNLLFNFTAWSRDNIPKGEPKFKVGDRVITTVGRGRFYPAGAIGTYTGGGSSGLSAASQRGSLALRASNRASRRKRAPRLPAAAPAPSSAGSWTDYRGPARDGVLIGWA